MSAAGGRASGSNSLLRGVNLAEVTLRDGPRQKLPDALRGGLGTAAAFMRNVRVVVG